MIDGLIKFLQKFSSNTHGNQNEKSIRIMRMIVNFFLLISLGGIGGIIWSIVLNEQFGIWKGLSLLAPYIIVSLWYFIRVVKNSSNTHKFRIIGTEIFPLVILYFLIISFIISEIDSWLAVIPFILVGISPLFILLNHFLGSRILGSIKSFLTSYSFMFFFVAATHALIGYFGIPGLKIFELIGAFISENGGMSLRGIEVLLFMGVIFLIFVGLIATLRGYKEIFGNSKKKFIWYLLIFILTILIPRVSDVKDTFDNYIIKNNLKTFQEHAGTYDSYAKLNHKLLKSAFLNQIKSGKFRHDDKFAKIFDATPEEIYGDEIAKYSNNRRSFATDSSKIGDAAQVLLNLAESTNTIIEKKDLSFIESQYAFHFENTNHINQEVVLHFQTPNKYSVVSDLVLGLNGELQGQIAPRGAAKKVYEDSLRRNTDPALIEKVGLNSYSLRVFPIPGKGKQKVVVTVLSPVLEKEITYAPKFSYINLKTDNDSRVISKIYKGEDLIQEDIKKGNEVDTYLSKEHTYNSDILYNGAEKACYHPSLSTIINTHGINLENKKELGKKISIFFDNSLSTKTNKATKEYADIYATIKNHGGTVQDLELYSFNHEVKKIAEMSDIKHWGHSDSDSIVHFLTKNKIENQKIIIVTDDSSFNYSEKEIKYNSESLATNQIHVIKVGKKIKSFKTDFNMLVSESQGNMYEYDSNSFSQTLDTILGQGIHLEFENCNTILIEAEVDIDPTESLFNSYFEAVASDGPDSSNFSLFLEEILPEILVNEYFPDDLEGNMLSGNAGYMLTGDNTKRVIPIYLVTKDISPREAYILKEYLYFVDPQAQSSFKLMDGGTIIRDFLELVDSAPPIESLPSQASATGSGLLITGKGDADDTDGAYLYAVQAGQLSELLLAQKSGNHHISEVQKIQNIIAEKFKIVNHFNSYIALETKRQQRDLDRYSEQNDAFESDYENFNSKSVSGNVVNITSRRDVEITGSASSNTFQIDTGSFAPSNSRVTGGGGGLNLSGRGEESLHGASMYYDRGFSTSLSFLGLYTLILYIYFVINYFAILISFFRSQSSNDPNDEDNNSKSNSDRYIDVLDSQSDLEESGEPEVRKNIHEVNISDNISLENDEASTLEGENDFSDILNEEIVSKPSNRTVQTNDIKEGIHHELVSLYEQEKFDEIKKLCGKYLSQGYEDHNIYFYLKKALEEEKK